MTATTAGPPRATAAHLSPRLTAATAGRVLRQLRHDHRTIAMMLVLPSLLLGPALPALEGPADPARASRASSTGSA